MENGQNMNALGRENIVPMKPLDQRDHANSNNDIMTRRLKNRERQRRYRARKRLEADMKKESATVNNSAPSQVEMQVSMIPDNYVTRVHCRRDWKKDARRAHAAKEQAVERNGAGFTSVNESQATSLRLGADVNHPIESESPAQDNNSERRFTPGRRHWKADARRNQTN